jgi:DNA-directed RNA polymerase specialized sigma24 family protein
MNARFCGYNLLILRQVTDQSEAEDILQDVFFEFFQAYQLLAPIEQASAWCVNRPCMA